MHLLERWSAPFGYAVGKLVAVPLFRTTYRVVGRARDLQISSPLYLRHICVLIHLYGQVRPNPVSHLRTCYFRIQCPMMTAKVRSFVRFTCVFVSFLDSCETRGI
jgi:hypothetical protein